MRYYCIKQHDITDCGAACLAIEEQLQDIEGGSIWKYIGALGAIGFGIYEVSTGVGVTHGVKNIFTGVTGIGIGVLNIIS